MAVAFLFCGNIRQKKLIQFYTGVELVFKEKISVKIGGYYEKTT